MNTDRASALRLVDEIHGGLGGLAARVDVAVFPPLVYLDAVGQRLKSLGSSIMLGAQDLFHEENGAYTGEVSAAMLKDLGVRYVLAGHSERRHLLGDSNETVRRKSAAVLRAGLDCILCVGEKVDERRAGKTDEVNELQVRDWVSELGAAALSRLTIAYEPVWAIGTGQTATPADAQNAHAYIRSLIAGLCGPDAAASMRIHYGGSVKSENAASLFAQPDVDGGLIGGASLNAGEFLKIIAAAATTA